MKLKKFLSLILSVAFLNLATDFNSCFGMMPIGNGNFSMNGTKSSQNCFNMFPITMGNMNGFFVPANPNMNTFDVVAIAQNGINGFFVPVNQRYFNMVPMTMCNVNGFLVTLNPNISYFNMEPMNLHGINGFFITLNLNINNNQINTSIPMPENNSNYLNVNFINETPSTTDIHTRTDEIQEVNNNKLNNNFQNYEMNDNNNLNNNFQNNEINDNNNLNNNFQNYEMNDNNNFNNNFQNNEINDNNEYQDLEISHNPNPIPDSEHQVISPTNKSSEVVLPSGYVLCPMCKHPRPAKKSSHNSSFAIRCPKCGSYATTTTGKHKKTLESITVPNTDLSCRYCGCRKTYFYNSIRIYQCANCKKYGLQKNLYQETNNQTWKAGFCKDCNKLDGFIYDNLISGSNSCLAQKLSTLIDILSNPEGFKYYCYTCKKWKDIILTKEDLFLLRDYIDDNIKEN